MIKKLYLIFILFQSQFSFSQLNYIFSSLSGSYNSIETGVNPSLLAANSPTRTLLDEGFANNIPIGFVFQYNGINYSFIHINTNGFAALGAPFLANSGQDPAYDINELRSAAGNKVAIKPVLAPFWDNLILSSASDLSYLTAGSAPNRVFTAQWKNTIWQSGASAISFQIKLYESTNIVEFIYLSEADAGGAGKGASIGISSEKQTFKDQEDAPLNFISLNSSTSTATINPAFETDNIIEKPATGQIFRFTPTTCMVPSGIFVSGFNTNSAIINWAAIQGATNYEVALSNIEVNPISGSLVAANTFTFNNLAENTQYFFYIRNSCGSAWNKYSFKTSTMTTLPYTESFESTLENGLPNNMTSITINNTFGDSFWQTTDLLASATGTKKAINSSPFMNANSWLFTPSFNLLAGGIYNLTYKISTTGGNNAIEVKFGNMAGEEFMVNTISIDNAISNTSYQTKNFNFTPSSTSEFIIGFANKTPVNNQIILLDDISVTQISAPLPLNLVYFKAKLEEENLVKLNWKTANEINVSHFEIEKSIDAKMFKEIGKTYSKISLENTDNKTIEYDFNDRNPEIGNNYYRLKMVDSDGKFSYSPIEIIRIKDGFVTELYPNPSDKEVYLRIKNTEGIIIKAYQLDGRELPINYSIYSNNMFKISTKELPITGVYLLQITSKTETRVLKWMVR